ncbi:hypothetical protein BKE38_15655 [Pseudoroseomonas deserti]|uniref:Cupin n=1 Tax=Teichococcus deserti TaxID=1817963 RepID=A0A1V2H0B1_9PROT|nr:hypothetical protein [Pseudoroseomonas deserti]ONG51800.1 hypothetical protein BKE38_15655 [Pseudoroseomonas deserti]
MKVLQRDELIQEPLPGRVLQRAIGRDSASASGKMTVSFCRYAAESGPMEPHHHAEETVVILDARDGWIRKGPAKDDLPEKVPVTAGTILHFAELEWHVFEYGPGGFIDACCIYGQVDNIRPEDIVARG